jgi:predicted glycogen debranching enzyme
MLTVAESNEWLEADGLGGFASGTLAGVRTRRYHALLLAARRPPTDRLVLVNGAEVFLQTHNAHYALSSGRYLPDVIHPDGARRIVAFTNDPWPRWTYRLEDGTLLDHEIFVSRDAACTVMTWKLRGKQLDPVLVIRPFLSGRDLHALHHENAQFDFTPRAEGDRLVWRPYDGIPEIVIACNGVYTHRPEWYRNFTYAEERARGLDDGEDLAAPGMFHVWLDDEGEAAMVLGAGALPSTRPALALAQELGEAERARRKSFASVLHRAADDYIVQRGNGRTIIAGYPWFTDWGRDTFIALRGLCLATGRLDVAGEILGEWAGAVSQGMLPNRFPDGGEAPEYNSVDASLWYVVAVAEYLAARGAVDAAEEKRLRAAVTSILDGYARGTRFGIRLDDDGLLACGQPGTQLTWMDAKIGDWTITPRVGKPVEIQALWLNALAAAELFTPRFASQLRRGLESFRTRFWNEARGCLYDVVDVDHRAGAVDATLRPNQIFAVGGLPLQLIRGHEASSVVNRVHGELWTPLGLRSLAPDEPGYAPHYEGDARQRDSVYHQGTVWPWLIGPFVEAWVRVHGATPEVKRAADQRLLAPLRAHLERAGIHHVSEIVDGDAPHTPRGCPFQAWSLGELLRLQLSVLAIPPRRARRSEPSVATATTASR